MLATHLLALSYKKQGDSCRIKYFAYQRSCMFQHKLGYCAVHMRNQTRQLTVGALTQLSGWLTFFFVPLQWKITNDREGTKSICGRMQMSPGVFTVQTGNTQKDEAEKREVGGGRPFSKGHRRSSNSLESLYSLYSGQSSSSKHLQAQSQVYSSHHGLMNYATHPCTLLYPVTSR